VFCRNQWSRLRIRSKSA